MSGQPIIQAFFDEPTNTISYLVADRSTKHAAVIDPVLDYDHNAGEVDTRSVEAILRLAEDAGYTMCGRSRPTLTRTISRARPISRPRREQRSASASTSRKCSASSGRCSMQRT